MEIDPANIVIVIQIIALVLFTIGVYPYRIRTKNRNLIMHGFLSILAFALNVFTILWTMIPALSDEASVLGQLSILQALVVWGHIGLGVAALAAGLIIIISWVTHPLGELGCSKTWRLMIPTFLVWLVVVILGIIIHVFEIM